jgi:hypothetical protein
MSWDEEFADRHDPEGTFRVYVFRSRMSRC